MKTTFKFREALLLATLALGSVGFGEAIAGDRMGNGGTDVEADVAASQAQLENVSLKIKHFFINNRKTLHGVFPEVDISLLIQKIDSAEINAIQTDNLIDKHGVDRSCLNFPSTNLIECKAKAISELTKKPEALFVLVFHEYLGLMGVEETSPANPEFIDGYSISKRLSAYVTKISDYDLQMSKAPDKCVLVIPYLSGETAKVLKDKGYNLVYEDKHVLRNGDYYLSYDIKFSYEHYSCIGSAKGIRQEAVMKLIKNDEVYHTLKTVKNSYCSRYPDSSETTAMAKRLPKCKD